MTLLIVAEHDNDTLNPNVFNTLTAASQMGDVLHLLVAGHECASVVDQATSMSNVSKVLTSSHESLADGLAENIAWLVQGLAPEYTHILAPASNFGKNFMPRVAAMLDVMQVSDIIEVVSEDTFVRPIYAGNALMTVQSTDSIKLITVRSTVFSGVETVDGAAEVEETQFEQEFDRAEFVSRDVTVSERPELTTA